MLPTGKCIPLMKVHHFDEILLTMVVQFKAENHSTNLARLMYGNSLLNVPFHG